MEQLFKLFLATYETLILIFFLNTLLNKRDELEKERRFAFCLYFLFQCVTYLIDFPFFSTSTYYIAFTVAISYLFYYNDIRIKLLSSGMFVTLNYASKLLSVSLFALINNISTSISPFNYVLNGQMQMIACVVMSLVIIIIVGMRKVDNRFTKIIVNILLFILPFFILYMSVYVLRDIETVNLYFNVTLLLFCYSFLLFFIVDQIVYSNFNSHQSKLIKESLNMQALYYKNMEQYNQDISRYKHDMMNHLNSIYGFLETNDTEEAKKYLTTLTEQMQNVKAVINTGNSVIDIIFNSKVNLARDNHIACTNNIVVPPHLKINNVDLSVILSNVLDNAIEANLKIKENRFIDTHIHLYKNSLFISVKNSFNGETKTSEEIFLSTKKDNTEHGIGLTNVSLAIQKYHGTKTIEHDDKTFTISIVLPNAY